MKTYRIKDLETGLIHERGDSASNEGKQRVIKKLLPFGVTNTEWIDENTCKVKIWKSVTDYNKDISTTKTFKFIK